MGTDGSVAPSMRAFNALSDGADDNDNRRSLHDVGPAVVEPVVEVGDPFKPKGGKRASVH